MPRKKPVAKTRLGEANIIEKIATRAHVLAAKNGAPMSRQDIQDDLAQVHRCSCRLRLADLLNADDVNFMHDIVGIRKNLDVTTGELLNHFWPRYAQPGE